MAHQLTLEDMINNLKIDDSKSSEGLLSIVPTPTKSIGITTLDECKKIEERILNGDIKVVEMQQGFESLIENKETIIAQLQKLKKAELLKIIGGFNRNDAKPQLIKSAFDSLLGMFVPHGYSWSPFTEKIEDALRREVGKLTDERFQEIIAERKAKREEFIKALSSPETLEEYRRFIDYRGIEQLTSEQREKYELLKADIDRSIRKSQAGWKASLGELELPEGVELSEVQHTCHTKHGHDLFVVSINQRVERGLFDQISKRAAIYDGKYSSYARDGAITGWQFREAEKAIQFRQLDKIDGAEQVENTEQRRKQKAVKHLLEVSGTLKTAAKQVLSVNRLTNTHRRVRMANSVEGQAFYDIQLAGTLRRLAEAVSGNEVNFIDRIMYKVEVEDFETMLSRGQSEKWKTENQRYCSGINYEPDNVAFISYPYPKGNKSNLLDLVEKHKNRTGLKLICNRIIKKIQSTTHEYLIIFKYESEIADLRKLLSVVKKYDRSCTWQTEIWQENLLTYDRMIRLELRTQEELRTALREYLTFRGSKPTQDPATILRRQIVGLKIAGYFPTPKDAADKLIQMANIHDGMSVCDPNAGTGHLLDVVRDSGLTVSLDAVEINYQLREILQACGYNVVENDFLSADFNKKYDRFIANPAFENANDVLTVQKMYRQLNSNGKLVAIVSEACFSNSRAPYTTFRDWFFSLPANCRTEEKLPQGTFLESDVRTGVNTRMISITKP